MGALDGCFDLEEVEVDDVEAFVSQMVSVEDLAFCLAACAVVVVEEGVGVEHPAFCFGLYQKL